MAKRTTQPMIRTRILLAAIRARRATSIVLFVVAVIAIAAAAIGPMFLQSADTSVLTSTANAASVGQTDLMIVSNGGAAQMSTMSSAAKSAEHLARGLLSPPIFTVDVGSEFVVKGQGYEADVLARSSVCAHVHFLEGSCPTRSNDVAISKRSATTAGVTIGSHLNLFGPHSSATTEVTVSAIYLQPSSVDDSYWRDNFYFDYGTGAPPKVVLDPLISSFHTALVTTHLASPQISADLAWRHGATLSGASVLRSVAAAIKKQLFSHYDLVVSSGLTSVVNVAQHDDDLMSVVVLAIVIQLIVLALMTLYFLGKSTILGRQQESEFARRHGFPRRALIALAIGEPATLIVAALPVGLVVAWGALAILAKVLFVPGTTASLPGVAILSAVGACVAGILAMTIASSDLWRSTSANGQRARRVGIAVGLDAFAVALALTGLLSLLTKGSLNGAKADPLALLAPGLLTLAAGILGLRIAAFLIRFLIARTGESRRVAWFLALRQIGRRPAVLRRLLPLAAATAVLLFAVGSFFLASSNRSLVAHFDVGAAKVVDVSPPPGLNFEAAVRRADPSGREAMAAAYYSSSSGSLLAVDSSRIAVVASWPKSLSSASLSTLARKLSPRVPKGVTFSGSELRVTLDVEKGTPAISLAVELFDETRQEDRTLYVGPVVPGLHSYSVSLVRACSGECRLTGLAPNWENTSSPYSKDVHLVLRGISVETSGSWHSVGFGADKVGTWKAQPSGVRVDPPGATCCSVAFDIPGGDLPYGGLVLSPVDLPAATPAIVTSGAETIDAPPSPSPTGNVIIELNGGQLTARPVAIVPTLPFIGDGGVIVNLDLAQRAFASNASDTTFQVWLAPSASPKILRRLRADGVTIDSTTSAATRLGVLDHSGIALAYAVSLIVSPIAALLALGTVTFIIASDGRRRRRDVTSLSMTGVPLRTIRRAYLLENAVVLAVALIIGAGVGYLTDSLALSSLPEFVVGTGGLPLSRAVPLTPFLCAVGILALLLAFVVELSTRMIVRDTRSRHENEAME